MLSVRSYSRGQHRNVERKTCSGVLAGAGNAKNTGFNFTEFVEFTAQLSEDIYGQYMETVVDRLLNVARCSTDRGALVASRECGANGFLPTENDDEYVIKVIKKSFK
jgi:hypothetical protein